MSQLLMDFNSEALTSSAEDSLVSLTPLQEAAKRLVTSVICGERSSALWGKRNPDGSWEKTSQDSLALNLEDSSGEWSMTWPRWGTAWDGQCMEHPTPERSTVETGSSSLGTPTSRDWKGAGRPGQLPTQMLPTPTANAFDNRGESSVEHVMKHAENRQAQGKQPFSIPLHVAVQMLPTPQAWDAKDYHAAKPEIVNTREQQKKRGGGCANLAERMAAMLPTPRSCSAMGAAINSNAEFPNLETVIAQSVAETGESGESAQRLGLNPEFVEVMMGFPIGWTKLKH